MGKTVCILVIFLAVSVLFQLGSSIRCYECTSRQGKPGYNESCLEKGANPTDYPTDWYCEKQTATIGGDVVVNRNGIDDNAAMAKGVHLNKCKDVIEGGITWKTCMCDGNLCNAAYNIGGIQLKVTAMVCFIAVHFLF